MDKDKLVKLFNKRNKIQGNNYTLIKGYSGSPNGFGKIYSIEMGNKGEDHYFSYRPSVEYLVDMNTLTKSLDMGLVNNKSFSTWYTKRKKKISNSDKEISFLNRTLVYLNS